MLEENQQSSEQGNELWPAPAYYRQLARLRSAVGQPVFLAEINMTAINAGVKIADESLVLLAVIDYPQPDPYRQLCPHMLVLDDGRGINLGRIARVSMNRAFSPEIDDILYQNQEFAEQVLFAPRELSRASLSNTSKVLLAQMFGDQPGRLLENCREEAVPMPPPQRKLK